ncbi:MAG: hypothetical protein H7326_01170, partial [Bdellovibrionaceae bacterium]|nr:hypothetical protein [Pseudobdellovibrionaceae bacterium]
MNRTGRLIIIGLLLLGACAPKVEDRAFGPAKTNFGPRTSDTDLSQKLNPSSVKTNLNWQGTIPTSIFFQQADNLVVLGKSSDRASISKLGISWIQKFYSDTNTTSNSELGDSPFAAIAATATEDEVQKTLGEVHADLENSRRVLKSKILELGESYPWPQKSTKLNAVLEQAAGFVNTVVSSIGSMPISKAIAEGVQAELKKSTDELFGEMQSVVVKLYAAKDFTKALETVD